MQASGVLEKLKQIITNPPVVENFDPNQPIYIQCDRSESGLRYCLF